ncbi:hypothetical protein NRB16_03135 [Pseudomonas sp. LJDD11]|uniref:hypothetical protein n=1 Tax=Pseudomonas sp. LJDD11 TaxID=2931984 RepID=UPI00211B94A2|nr:hypothetical protein [Pseudomonas sp. LJDD11]MCQ9422522.1 hypothetical protein [Pseudomonas sp. LJDD11]
MYRRSLLVLLVLSLAGCYGGASYYESDVYTQPTIARGYYDGPGYYQERRIYVAPPPRYYGPPPPRYYAPQPRYYGPPPGPRLYVPGRPPGQAWEHRGRDYDRHPDRNRWDDRRDRNRWDDRRDRNRWDDQRQRDHNRWDNRR